MGIIHHSVTYSETPENPFRVVCVCGMEGNFPNRAEALNYAGEHLRNIQGINTKEFIDLTKPPIVKAAAAGAEDADSAIV